MKKAEMMDVCRTFLEQYKLPFSEPEEGVFQFFCVSEELTAQRASLRCRDDHVVIKAEFPVRMRNMERFGKGLFRYNLDLLIRIGELRVDDKGTLMIVSDKDTRNLSKTEAAEQLAYCVFDCCKQISVLAQLIDVCYSARSIRAHDDIDSNDLILRRNGELPDYKTDIEDSFFKPAGVKVCSLLNHSPIEDNDDQDIDDDHEFERFRDLYNDEDMNGDSDKEELYAHCAYDRPSMRRRHSDRSGGLSGSFFSFFMEKVLGLEQHIHTNDEDEDECVYEDENDEKKSFLEDDLLYFERMRSRDDLPETREEDEPDELDRPHLTRAQRRRLIDKYSKDKSGHHAAEREENIDEEEAE